MLKEDGSYLSFREFKGKFSCNTNFMQYFQIISAIPSRLRLEARQIESVNNQFFTSNGHLFHFNRNFILNLDKAKSRSLDTFALYFVYEIVAFLISIFISSHSRRLFVT